MGYESDVLGLETPFHVTDVPDQDSTDVQAAPQPSQQLAAPADVPKHTDPVDHSADITDPEFIAWRKNYLSSGDQKQALSAAPVPKNPRYQSYEDKVIKSESSGDPNAKSKTSNALGLGQFEPTTWLNVLKQARPDLVQGKSDDQILAMRTDPDLSRQMISYLGNKNADALRSMGIPVSDATKYGAHWFGTKGFNKIYNADPMDKVEDVIGQKAAAANGLVGKRVEDVRNLLAKKMGEDYMQEKLTPWQAAKETAYNAPSSVGHAVAGVADLVLNPSDTWNMLKQVGTGLRSKIAGYAGHEQDSEQKAKDEALIDNMVNSYGNKYSSWENFENYLAHDPASVAMDASVVAGGVGLTAAKTGSVLGRVGGAAARAGETVGNLGKIAAPIGAGIGATGRSVATAGDFLRAAGKGVSAAGEFVNPLNPGGILTKGISKIAPGTYNALDKAGNIVPEIDSDIRRISGNTMSANDLSEDAKTALAESLKTKGRSDPVIREGLMKGFGLGTPTPVVNQTAPLPAARAAVADVVQGNNEKLANAASSISGAAAPSDTAVASNLEKAIANKYNKSIAEYNALGGIQGSFGTTMDTKPFFDTVQDNLSKKMIPSTQEEIMKETALPKTQEAINHINDVFTNGNTQFGANDINASQVLWTRKKLSNLLNEADGNDRAAMGAVMDSYDKFIQDSAERGKFLSYEGPDAGKAMASHVKNASQYYREYKNMFENPNGLNNPIVNAAKTITKAMPKDENTGFLVPTDNPDIHTQVQQSLVKPLFDPKAGPNAHGQLINAMGGDRSEGANAVNSWVQHSVLKNDGLSLNPDKKISALLSNPNGSPVLNRAFSSNPDSLKAAKNIHTVHNINNAKPTSLMSHHSFLSDMFGKASRRAGAGLIGYSLGHGPMGFIAGEALEGGAEHIADKMAAKRAMSGAKSNVGVIRRGAGKVGRALTNPTALMAGHYLANAKDYAQADGGRVGRASGGAVNHASEADRLVALADRAKKSHNNQTKPLLAVPDETITHALAIANDSV